MDNFNDLTPAEAERLALLLEELGEVQQVVGKILRHGYESYSPFDPDKKTNRQMLEKELGDALHAINLLTKSHDVREDTVDHYVSVKSMTVRKWLHHQPKPKHDNGGGRDDTVNWR